MKAQLVLALWLGGLIGGCGGDAPRSKAGGRGETDVLPCESPEQAGCAECCVEQIGPVPGEVTCHLRTASAVASQRGGALDYAEAAAFLKAGPCPVACRPCAACTQDRKKSYQRLLSQGCDCVDPFVRDIVRGIDPCFSGGCGCICSHLAQLSECGPPI